MASGSAAAWPSAFVVICCPVSGKKDAVQVLERDFWPQVRKLGIVCELQLTAHAGHAVELAEAAARAGKGVVAVGGDGTLHEVMDGLIRAGALQRTVLAVLSQGTMNCLSHSAALPDAAALPALLAAKSSRPQSLMRVQDETGKIKTICFEAMYLGVGYKPAKGAQEYRNSFIGPFGGIMLNLIRANLFPASTAIAGTLTMWPKQGGAPRVVKDKFFWIVICQRNPYNGVITPDSTWVSWVTLDNFPGFGRMMDAFSPPMEFQSGVTGMLEGHVEVAKVTWEQDVGTIGVCLDGDPMEGGKVLTVEHMSKAWTVVADKTFPSKITDKLIKARPLTAYGRRGLEANPPPKDLLFPLREQLAQPATLSKRSPALLYASVLVVAGAVCYAYMAMQPNLATLWGAKAGR